jgi:hypothetical protein
VENSTPINDEMLGEQLMEVSNKSAWYADIVNYLVCGIVPKDFSYAQKKKFLHEVKRYSWDEPFSFKHCADGIMRRCIPEEEVHDVIYHCHSGNYGGHSA